jgi:cell division protein FtsB
MTLGLSKAKPFALNHSLIISVQRSTMVIRRRLRAFLFPLALYCVSGAVSSYFVWHAVHGDRGLLAKVEYRQQAAALQSEHDGLKGERQALERRIAMLRAESVERDLLEEEARVQLGRVHRNDVVIFLPR